MPLTTPLNNVYKTSSTMPGIYIEINIFCCDGETDDEDDDVGKPHF